MAAFYLALAYVAWCSHKDAITIKPYIKRCPPVGLFDNRLPGRFSDSLLLGISHDIAMPPTALLNTRSVMLPPAT